MLANFVELCRNIGNLALEFFGPSTANETKHCTRRNAFP